MAGELRLMAEPPLLFGGAEGRRTRTLVPAPRALLGRDEDADVVIVDHEDEVSRRHAVLEAGPRGWTIRDVSSTGTFLVDRDGETFRVERDIPEVLRNGMGIRLGERGVLRVRIDPVQAKGRPTRPPVRGRGGPGSDASMRSPDMRRIGWMLTAPYRERPVRRDATPVREIADELVRSRSHVYNVLKQLAALPGIRLTTQPGTEAHRRELAAQLVDVYGHLFGPEGRERR